MLSAQTQEHCPMPKVAPIHKRKADHIKINLEQDVRSGLTSGLEKYHFIHEALPELDLNRLDTTLNLFGKPLAAPILISSMTGGTPEAETINLRLAEAAQEAGVAMGVGSQRAAIEHPEQAKTFQVRGVAPDILLFANLGAVQFNYGYTSRRVDPSSESIARGSSGCRRCELRWARQKDRRSLQEDRSTRYCQRSWLGYLGTDSKTLSRLRSLRH
jgi:isopentenyl diphosphate isomerase/L-lactate dehydrogenase-like FMN-dependent dehydrogenase